MKPENLDVLKKIRLGEKYPRVKPTSEEERELHNVLSRLKDLEVLFVEKNSYRVKNSKLLNKFINTPDFETLTSFLET